MEDKGANATKQKKKKGMKTDKINNRRKRPKFVLQRLAEKER